MALPLIALAAAHPWITSSVGASILGPMAGNLGSDFVNWLKNNPGDARFKDNLKQSAQSAPLAQLGRAAVQSTYPTVVPTTPASTLDYLNSEDSTLNPETVGATNTVVGDTSKVYDPVTETAKAQNILKKTKPAPKAKTPINVEANTITETMTPTQTVTKPADNSLNTSSLSWLNDLLPYLAVGGLAYMAGKKF